MSDANREAERGSTAALGSHLIIPVLACALTIYYFVSTVGLVWEARATGTFIGAILIILCTAQFIRFGLRLRRGEGSLGFGSLFEDNFLNRQRLALLVLVALFIIAINWVGTTLGLFLLLMASMRLMGVRSLRTLLAVSLVTAAMVHGLLIYLLGSQLPQGVFKNLFSMALGGA